MKFYTRNMARAELALQLAGGSFDRANAIARTGLLDVALDGRQAVRQRAAHPNRKHAGAPYRKAA